MLVDKEHKETFDRNRMNQTNNYTEIFGNDSSNLMLALSEVAACLDMIEYQNALRFNLYLMDLNSLINFKTYIVNVTNII